MVFRIFRFLGFLALAQGLGHLAAAQRVGGAAFGI